MSSLIIGGLLGIAVLAIIGLVFLIRSTPSQPKKVHDTPYSIHEGQRARDTEEALQVSQVAQAAQGGTPLQSVPTSQTGETRISHNQEEAPDTEATVFEGSTQSNIQNFPIATRHFHSLSVELRALQSQAQEIEQRINQLSNIIERVEYDQDRYVDIDSQEGLHEIENASKN